MYISWKGKNSSEKLTQKVLVIWCLPFTLCDGHRLIVFFSEGGVVNSSDVWSKFEIISLWIQCSKMKIAIFLFKEKVNSLYSAGFVSLFAVVPSLLTQAIDFNILHVHSLVVSGTLPTFFAYFFGHWELRTPITTCDNSFSSDRITTNTEIMKDGLNFGNYFVTHHWKSSKTL